MNIVVVGSWYVGLTQWACLASLGHDVVCIDIDKEKIDRLKQWIIPIYEPWLDVIVKDGLLNKKLFFSTSLKDFIDTAEIVFIAVGTPTGSDGQADLQYVNAVAKELWRHLKKYTIIVNKSTVPVWTWDVVAWIIDAELQARWMNIQFDIVSNPEFLKEWTAIKDFLEGDRIVIGCDNPNGRALQMMEKLYRWLTHTTLLKTNVYTAELIKYSANALLAVEVSFINSIAQLCEKVWADVTVVSQWLKLDSRIWKKAFLDAWPWFGGSCFPKDVIELAQVFRSYDIPNGILDATLSINDMQKQSIVDKIKLLVPVVSWMTVSILWLAFKPDTDDIRYASSLVIVEALLQEGAVLRVYDPQAMENFKRIFLDVYYAWSPADCVEWSSCVVLLTHRDELLDLDRSDLGQRMLQKNLIDARNVYDMQALRDLWFTYVGVGR